jgi:hypothetical protein
MLETLGYSVLHPAEKIGGTGLRTPVDILVQSAGYGYGTAEIQVNGATVDWRRLEGEEGAPTARRGYNLAILSPTTGDVLRLAHFDVSAPEGNMAMAAFLNSVPNDYIVAAAMHDDASGLTENGLRALRSIGCSGGVGGRVRCAHAVIGVKGSAPGNAVEVIGQRCLVEASVLAGNTTIEGEELANFIAKTVSGAGRECVYLTGSTSGDSLAWFRVGG